MLRRAFFLIFLLFIASLPKSSAQDTQSWISADGSKTIKAEYLRISSKAVVVRLDTGKEATLPFVSLNLESQLQALRRANPDAVNKDLVKASEVVAAATISYQLQARDVLFSPFTAETSIDAFMQTFVEELNKGNWYIVWHALPPKMQQDLATVISRHIQALGAGRVAQFGKLTAVLGRIAETKRDWVIEAAGNGPGHLPMTEAEKNEITAVWPYLVSALKNLSSNDIWQPANFTPEAIQQQWVAPVLTALQPLAEAPFADQSRVGSFEYKVLSSSTDRAEVQLLQRGRVIFSLQLQKEGYTWIPPVQLNLLRKFVDQELSTTKTLANPFLDDALQSYVLVLPVLQKIDQAKTKDETIKLIEAFPPFAHPCLVVRALAGGQ